MRPTSQSPGQNPSPAVLGSDSLNPATAEVHRAETALDLEGVRRRDPKALEEFFEAFFDRVFRLVYRLLGDRTLAEDAAQEVFLKIHRGAHLLDPKRDPGPWVTAIATNVCRDFWRSGAYRMSHVAVPLDDTPGLKESLPSRGLNPEGEAIASERTRIVREAILMLREPLREVLILREYEGLEYEEIAAMTGLNEAAVRKRYSRALGEMGKFLKKAGL